MAVAGPHIGRECIGVERHGAYDKVDVVMQEMGETASVDGRHIVGGSSHS